MYDLPRLYKRSGLGRTLKRQGTSHLSFPFFTLRLFLDFAKVAPIRTGVNPLKIDLLDHGYLRLVDSMGSDLSVVRSARVSYDADWRAGDDTGSDERLINYLVKNRHTSPLESVQFTFEVKCPMFVARQWMRHRSWGYNEVSARYSILPNEMYVPAKGCIGTQNSDNKQMRDLVELNPEHEEETRSLIRNSNQQAYAMYELLVARGVPREIARGSLPMNIYTHFFATVDLHNLLGFIGLRDHSHSQYEIQVYGQAATQLIEPIVPVTVAAFKKHVLEKRL